MRYTGSSIKNNMDTVDQVLEDLKARKQLGIERYGKALRSDNERDMLWEAYEEAMDLCVYLRAELDRRG